MTNRKIFPIAIIAFLAIGVLMASCKKDEEKANEIQDQQASDQSWVELAFNDVGLIADEAGLSGSVNLKGNEQGSLLSPCATVSRDTIAIPHLLTIDFGSTNCLCLDGVYRRGKIVVTYLGHYMDSLAFHTIGFDDFFINDNQLLGTKTVQNQGHNTLGNLWWTVEVIAEVVLANNAGLITWEASRVREMTGGELTPQRFDDVYLLSGTSSGTRLNGLSWTSEILTPLRIERSCQFRHPVSGSVEIIPQGKPVRILDYGSGACDKVATLTINGVTYNIILH